LTELSVATKKKQGYSYPCLVRFLIFFISIEKITTSFLSRPIEHYDTKQNTHCGNLSKQSAAPSLLERNRSLPAGNASTVVLSRQQAEKLMQCWLSLKMRMAS